MRSVGSMLLLVACGPSAPPPADTDTAGGTDEEVLPDPAVPDGVEWKGQLDDRLASALHLGDEVIVSGSPGGTGREDSHWPSTRVFGAPLDGSFQGQTVLMSDKWGSTRTENRLGAGVLLPGDVTGDGLADLIAFDPVGYLGGGAFLLPGPITWRGTLTVEEHTHAIDWPGPRRGTPCGDVNGDGAVDLCLATGVAFGPVGTDIQPDVTWSVVQPDEEIHLAAADLDGDGTPELLLWDPRTSSLHRLDALPAGDHDPATLAGATFTLGAGPVTAIEAGRDWTGDGRLDVILAAAGQIHVLSGPALEPVLVLPFDATALAGGDFDGDGHADLAIGTGASVRIHLGPLPGSVAAIWIGREHPTDAFGAALSAADLNGDGRADLAVGAPEHLSQPLSFPQPGGRLYLLWGGGLP